MVGALWVSGLTFQAILQLNTGSQPGSIVLNYVDVDSGSITYNNGGSASVGIKDTGTQGGNRLLVSRDLVNNPFYTGGGKAVRVATDWTAPTVTTSGFTYLTGPQTLTYQFSKNVQASLSTADLTLTNTTTAQVIPTASISLTSYNSGTNTATFTFPGYPAGLPDGNYTATLASSGVTDVAWNPLAGNTSATFFTLAGDTDHSKTVDTLDFNSLATNFSQTGCNWSQGDFNYDTTVNTIDFNLLAANFSLSLPADSGGAANATAASAPNSSSTGGLFSSTTIRRDPLEELSASADVLPT